MDFSAHTMSGSISNHSPDARFNVALRKAYLIGLILLAPLTAIKFGDIETVEVYSLMSLLVVTAALYHNRLRLRASRTIVTLLRAYLIFLALAAVCAFWALRLRTYPPPGVSFLKTAPYVSIARLVQLSAGIGSLLLTAQLIASRPQLCALAAQCYVYAGLISCVYGLVSWVALPAGLHLGGAYGVSHRVRAFFVEGGPFGVYLISVITVCVFRRRILRRGNAKAYWFQLGLLFLALAAATSKAAILLGLVLVVYYMFVTKRLRYLFAVAPPLVLLAYAAHLPANLEGYFHEYIHFAVLAKQNPDDTSLVEGRVMASILVPIMVAHHPITGVGIGNYSLQRNNPQYLGTLLPESPGWDLPGLGLIGYVAELGIPLTLYLYWILWRPVYYSRRAQAPTSVVLLAAYQTFAHTLGAQPTFVYPWIVSGIALGYCLCLNKTDPLETMSYEHQGA